MACNGCPGNDKENPDVDKRGNLVVGGKAEMEGRLEETHKPKELPPDLKNMSYEQYTSEKDKAREYGRKMGQDAVKAFPMNHKRIQIKELIDVVNHEDGGPLSPTQALQALYDFSKMQEYLAVFNEFPGLEKRVIELYEKLVKNNKIIVKWTK